MNKWETSFLSLLNNTIIKTFLPFQTHLNYIYFCKKITKIQIVLEILKTPSHPDKILLSLGFSSLGLVNKTGCQEKQCDIYSENQT